MLLVLTLNRIDVINWTPNHNVSLHQDAFMVKLDCTHLYSIIYSVSFLCLTFSNCHPLFCNNHHSNVGCSEQERKVVKVVKVRKASTLRITILEEGCVS